MTLHWTTTALNNIAGGSDQATTGAPQTLHSSECLQADTETVKLAMEACLDKALSFLDQNVNDDSLFFLCEWNMKSCELSIVVTDETKSVDSPHRINCIFTGLATSSESSANDTEALSENVRFWLKDYMSLSDEFLRYSIIAMYTDASRQQTVLL